MSHLTNYGENKLVDMIRGQALSLPADWYLSLLSAGDDATLTEISGYARQPAARSLAEWAGTQGAGTTAASNGTSHRTSNNSAVDFGLAGGAITVNAVGLHDALTSGNAWAWAPLVTPLVLALNDPIEFDPGAIEWTLGATGGLSDYLSNKLIDLLWRGQAYTWPNNQFCRLMTSAPTNAGGGTEVSGGSYAAQAIASSLTAWAGTQGDGTTSPSNGTSGKTSNNDPVIFPSPSAGWGTVSHFRLDDASSGGNMLFWAAMDAPRTVAGGGPQPRFNAAQLSITFA